MYLQLQNFKPIICTLLQYEDPNYQNYHTSRIEGVYEYAVPHNETVQIEGEQKIYDTSYEDDGDYGPIYTNPPTAVEKIYETFEGKRFCKLFHQNIRYLQQHCYYKQLYKVNH